jgi:glyoxylate reductase
MRILYHSRHRIPENFERELAAQWVDHETLMRESDFLSLHVPLTQETRHSISRREFALMKPTAFVINTARGNIIDEEALVETLRAGRLGGAGLDVFEQEPKAHPALIVMKNVVLLPHVGSATAETRLRMALLASVNLLAALDGRRPPNLVNPDALS